MAAGPAKKAAGLIRMARIPHVEAKGDGVNQWSLASRE